MGNDHIGNPISSTEWRETEPNGMQAAPVNLLCIVETLARGWPACVDARRPQRMGLELAVLRKRQTEFGVPPITSSRHARVTITLQQSSSAVRCIATTTSELRPRNSHRAKHNSKSPKPDCIYASSSLRGTNTITLVIFANAVITDMQIPRGWSSVVL